MSDKVSHVKPFLKYTVLPGLIPRIYELFSSGFSYFAFLMASIYNIFNLIPKNHPYLNASNIGRFGIRHVVSEAGKNLVFKRENIDQIIIYFLLLGALIILALQFLFLALALAAPVAMATPLSTYFGTNPAAGPEQDIAFILLDRVFGVEDIFNSCVTTATNCVGLAADLTDDAGNVILTPQAPWPFHLALHNMFRFYSTGLLMVGLIVIIYHVLAVTIETAQTGTPFGKRFNTVWAPIRLVVAIGLLIPINTGLNSAQYIVLYAAKLGSNMATNGWITFNTSLANAINGGGLINADEMIGTPNAPDVKELVMFMVLAKACAIGEDSALQNVGNDDDPGGTFPSGDEGNLGKNKRNSIQPWLVRAIGAPNNDLLELANYSDARTFYENGDILIRFGELSPLRFKAEKGGVHPWCGELVLKNSALYEPGALAVQAAYYNLINSMWNDGAIRNLAHAYVGKQFPRIPVAVANSNPISASTWNVTAPQIPADVNQVITNLQNTYVASVKNSITAAINAQKNSADFGLPADLLARGWGGAGIWYNRIAQMNGAMVGASRNLPSVKSYPATMKFTMDQHKILDENVGSLAEKLAPHIKEKSLNYPRTAEEGLQKAFGNIVKDFGKSDSELTVVGTGNPVVDAINMLFGTEGLMNLRSPENRNVHPLAQLSGVGKSLIESAVIMLGIGTAGGVACLSGTDAAESGCSVMGFAFKIVGLGLTIGFILFYIIPFLPFIYFFFAVGNWVKSIFEAMVGAPLWALGHLRIDGDGLPGEGAMNGYYLIFEIFLRPILVVFGFLAAILIFGAMATVLNDIWDIVTVNASGFNSNDPGASGGGTVAEAITWSRSQIDQIFFLVIYAVVMYMMALSSFKLIDMIPNSILRWMGSSVQSFGDSAQDAAQSLTQYAAIGGGMVFQQGLGGVQGGISGVRQGQVQAAQAEAKGV